MTVFYAHIYCVRCFESFIRRITGEIHVFRCPLCLKKIKWWNSEKNARKIEEVLSKVLK